MIIENNKTILVVDDDDDIRKILSIEIQEMEFNVIESYSGENAVEKIQAYTIDLIISDLKMPFGDGFYILDYLKNEDIKTPIIICSGFTPLLAPALLSPK